MNQCWFIDNCTLRNNIQGNFDMHQVINYMHQWWNSSCIYASPGFNRLKPFPTTANQIVTQQAASKEMQLYYWCTELIPSALSHQYSAAHWHTGSPLCQEYASSSMHDTQRHTQYVIPAERRQGQFDSPGYWLMQARLCSMRRDGLVELQCNMWHSISAGR